VWRGDWSFRGTFAGGVQAGQEAGGGCCADRRKRFRERQVEHGSGLVGRALLRARGEGFVCCGAGRRGWRTDIAEYSPMPTICGHIDPILKISYEGPGDVEFWAAILGYKGVDRNGRLVDFSSEQKYADGSLRCWAGYIDASAARWTLC